MKNAAKILARSAYMFNPKDRGDPEEVFFLQECALAAGQFLEYIVADGTPEGDPDDLFDSVALGGLVIAAVSLAKLQNMDLHELMGAVMSAYRDTDVQHLVDRDVEEDDDGTKH